MGLPRDQYGAFPQTSHKPRAWILLKSGRRLDLLDPRPDAWTDKDLAIWDLPNLSLGRLLQMGSSPQRRPA